MVRVTFYRDRDQIPRGFDCLGHAEYADGSDIVCAAVSALTINCVNSVETFTEDAFDCSEDSGEGGEIRFRFQGQPHDGARLLLNSLLLGLREMERNYGEYVDVTIEEV